MSDVKYAYYHSSKGYKIVGGNSNQLLRADGGVEDKTDYSVKSANETFVGEKTFTLSPIIPNATSPNHAVNKEQLDAKIPYTGATANVNLGTNIQIKAKEFDAIGTYVEKPNTNRNYEFVKINGGTIGVSQSHVWNGSAWDASGSFGFGSDTLQYNKGVYSNGFGMGALKYNTGSSSNGFGHYALQYNTGSSSNGFGHYALQYNTGNNSNGIGYISLIYNTGNNSNGFGYNALRYNTGNNNSVLGYNSFANFYIDTVNAKLFDATAIDVVAKTITIPNHAFGANGTYTNLRFVQGDSAVTGLSNGAIVQVKIIDANTIAFEEVIQSGQVRRNVNITNAGTGTGHKFEPQKSLSNINILGANINPTKSNQTIFAGGEAILPQSTVATIDGDATNKALITKEWYNSKTSTSLSNYYTKSEAVNMFVGLNGVQTIGGTKTFTESPIVPTPTLNAHAVNKSYVDVQLGSYMPTTHVANSITPTNIANWNTAYGWGNHASAGYAMANHTHSWNEIENKPLTFVPTSHTHAISEVIGLSTELDKKSEKNTDEEWNSKKYLSNPFPLIFNDPTENTRRFGFHKPNNISSVILVPSTEPDSDNWDWANQIEFKENGKIKNKGYEIAGYDDNYVLTAGGNQAHKKDLLWTKKDSYGADGSTTTVTPKGLLTTVHIMDDTSIYTRFVLPRSATNGQKILFINDSPAAWVEVFDSTETISAKAYNSENLEFTFIRELDGEGVLSGNGNWHAFSPTDGKIKL